MENDSKVVTLGFPVDFGDGRIWLAQKKKKLCEGKLNGYGGSRRITESIRGCMIREFSEESGASTYNRHLTSVGGIVFNSVDGNGETRLICFCFIYLITHWTGEMIETEEMGSPESFGFDDIPFDRMMPSDIFWLNQVLRKTKRVSGSITLNEAMSAVVKHDLTFR